MNEKKKSHPKVTETPLLASAAGERLAFSALSEAHDQMMNRARGITDALRSPQFTALQEQARGIHGLTPSISRVIEQAANPPFGFQVQSIFEEINAPYRKLMSEIYAQSNAIGSLFRKNNGLYSIVSAQSNDYGEIARNLVRPFDKMGAIPSFAQLSFVEKLHTQLYAGNAANLLEALQRGLRDVERFHSADVVAYDTLTNDEIDDINNAIVEVATDPKSLTNYSSRTKTIILFILLNMLIPILLNFATGYTLIVWQEKRMEWSGQAVDMKELIRDVRKEIPLYVRTSYRLTSVDRLRLRDEPNLKSEIITLLEQGTLLHIINKDNRSWLLVEVMVGEELLTGWVSRRYTKILH